MGSCHGHDQTPDATHQNHDHHDTAAPTLLGLLRNPLLLLNTAPHLPVSSLLNLAAASSDFHGIVCRTPGVFRHLDLTSLRAAQFDIDAIDHGGEVWRNVQLDENLTEDE